MKLVEDAVEKVKLLDRASLLRNPGEKNESEIIPYITTFNPFNPEIFSEIRQYKRILQASVLNNYICASRDLFSLYIYNLRKRTTLHNQHIRHENLRMIPLSGHIASCSRNEPKYFMFPFYKMKTDSIIDRKEKEKYFIQKYKPELNST